MIARGSGAIVNISTMGASVGVADAPVAAALHLKDIRKDNRLG